MIANGAPEAEKGLAQTMTGFAFRLVGPEQTGQGFAAMGPVLFDGQIGQQGPHLVIFKGGDRLPCQDNFKSAK